MVPESVASLVAGLLFGFALAAPPGPMNAIIAEESVLRGWFAGFRTGLGAMTADAVFFVLALIGVVGIVERAPTVRAVLIVIGGFVMLYFALGAARNADAVFRDAKIPSTGRGFTKALILGLTNPYQILFWLTVGVALLDPGRMDLLGAVPVLDDLAGGSFVVKTGSPWLVGGLFAGILVWTLCFPKALVEARERVSALAGVVAILSALILSLFAIVFLWNGLGLLTG